MDASMYITTMAVEEQRIIGDTLREVYGVVKAELQGTALEGQAERVAAKVLLQLKKKLEG